MVEGIRTNVAWFDGILRSAEFREGRLSTDFLERFRAAGEETGDLETEAVAAVVASLRNGSRQDPAPHVSKSAWAIAGRGELMR